MHYQESFYLDENTWNNSFSYEKRRNKKLYIPPLINWTIEDLKITNEISFQVEENWKIKTFSVLENFVKINNKKIYIFDNHNHALYFWYKAYHDNIIQKNSILVHIDQHSDMREPETFIEKEDLDNIRKYTNYHTNVWNFIIPAINSWLIWEVHQIRTLYSLENFHTIQTNKSKILDIDIDFWEESMENNANKDSIVKNMIWKFDLITIATSPYFIDQKKAIDKIKELLSNS